MRYRMDYTLIKRKMPSGKTIYYYAVYDDDNKRVYRSTGERTKALADRYVRQLIEDGRLGVMDRSCVKLKDYAADFFVPGKCPIEKNAHARGRSLTKSTLAIRRTALVEHIFPHLGQYSIYSLSDTRINKWLIELPETDKVSRTTANSYLVALRCVLEQAVKDGIIATNPCKKVENLGSDTKRRKAFTKEEVRTLIGKESDWDNPMIRTICMTSAITGMRMGEVRALKPEYISKEAIIIKASFSNEDGYKTPKNGLERLAPIPEGLYNALMKFYKGPDRYLFSLYDPEKPLSSNWIKKSLDKRMEQCGIKGKSFHSFREFFNTQMMAANVNETAIRAIMGHATSEMTRRYLHTDSAEFPVVRKVVETLDAEIIA